MRIHCISKKTKMNTTTTGIRAQQLDKVTDKALSTIRHAAGGTFFRRHLSSLHLDAGLPSSDKTITSTSSSSSSSTNTTQASNASHTTTNTTTIGKKRRHTTDEKHQIDAMSTSLLVEVTQRVKDDFTRYIGSSELRTKLNVLDELFVQQPKLPGGDGERVPAVLPENPTDLLRAKRMRLKIADREGLEQLLHDAHNVNAKLEADLARDRSLLGRCEKELERRAYMLETAYSSLPKK
jgi:hypothetical protein